MTMRRYTVPITTASDGTGSGATPRTSGRIQAIHYVKNGSTPYDNTVDFTVTLEASGEGVWAQSNVTASTTVHPRAATHKNDGTAALYAAGGLGVLDQFALAQDRVLIAVAQGGSTKTGTFYVVIEG